MLGVALLAGMIVAGLPLVWWAVNAYVDPETPSERSDLIRALAQIGGGLLLLIGLYFTARTLRINQQTLRLNERGQVTERFTRAIDQLGATDKDGRKLLEVRLGAIYALERIARDSTEDGRTIMEVLSAYVRENAQRPPVYPDDSEPDIDPSDPANWGPETPGGPTAPADIQAAMTVIGRRLRTNSQLTDVRIRFDRADLRYADLSDLDFRGASFAYADLHGASLINANLMGSYLEETVMSSLNLKKTNLYGAWFVRTDLYGTDLSGLQLDGADFTGCDLRKAKLERTLLANAVFKRAYLQSTTFKGADLRGAVFEDAVLYGVQFAGAKMDDADLRETDLSQSKGLTAEQLQSANWDDTTEFPPALVPTPPSDFQESYPASKSSA